MKMNSDLKKSHSIKSNFFLLIITLLGCISLPLLFVGIALLFSNYQLSIPLLIIGMITFVISSVAFMCFKRWLYA